MPEGGRSAPDDNVAAALRESRRRLPVTRPGAAAGRGDLLTGGSGEAAARRRWVDALDSVAMEARDRLTNLGLFAGAAVTWILVGLVVTTRDPRLDPTAGFLGSGLIGLAMGLTSAPLFWLVAFGRHRRIAYRGDWLRAVRRGAWVAGIVALFAVLRIQGIFQPPIALFVVAMVLVAESTLSAER